MNDRTLPQDTYIDAVVDALAAVGIDAADHWTSGAETRGLHPILNATIALTPEDSQVSADRWPDGLLLIWEWHPGREEDENPRGPVWLWAKKQRDGSNSEPISLPVDGYTNPTQVAAALHELDATGTADKWRPGRWDGAGTLEAEITAWDAAEAGDAR